MLKVNECIKWMILGFVGIGLFSGLWLIFILLGFFLSILVNEFLINKNKFLMMEILIASTSKEISSTTCRCHSVWCCAQADEKKRQEREQFHHSTPHSRLCPRIRTRGGGTHSRQQVSCKYPSVLQQPCMLWPYFLLIIDCRYRC